MPKDDRVRLRHMLDAANEAIAFARGKSRTELGQDRLLALGLLKCIEIVGEAAARVVPDVQRRYPQIVKSRLIVNTLFEQFRFFGVPVFQRLNG